MGNLEALKALYVAQGGAAEDVANMTTLSEVIAALAANGGGGGSDFTVTFTFDEDDHVVSDKTSTEILEQFAHKPIRLVLGYGTYQAYYPQVLIMPGSDSVTLQYSSAYYDETDGAAVYISEAAVDASGNVTESDDKIYPLTPATP